MAQQRQAHSADIEHCIETCLECHNVCTETVQICLEKGGSHASAEHVRLLLDCAQICQTSADFMVRGSDLHTEACAVCADVCERCAESCDAMKSDEAMRRCADVCRRCAESCRRSAGNTRIAHAA